MAVLDISKIYGPFWSGPFWFTGRFGIDPFCALFDSFFISAPVMSPTNKSNLFYFLHTRSNLSAFFSFFSYYLNCGFS